MTIKAGVVGSPAKHSLSPAIHGAWLKAAGIDGEYGVYDIPLDGFPAFVETARHILSGMNVTVPFKVPALALAEIKLAAAEYAGAANVLQFRDGVATAYNTDGLGLLAALKTKPGFDPKAGPVVLYGAGGAARGAVAALVDAGVPEVRLVNRTHANAQAIIDHFPPGRVSYIHRTLTDEANAMTGAIALINSTTLGMKGQGELHLDLDPLPASAVVLDMVYAPLETDLLKQAKAQGFFAVDGLEMLIGQARPSFEVFFGAAAPVEVDARAICLAEMERRA